MIGKGNKFVVLKAGDDLPEFKVIDNPGFQSFNKTIAADCGTVVPCHGLTKAGHEGGLEGCIELWVDDEGAVCSEEGQPRKSANKMASVFAGQMIFGDVIMVYSDASSGETHGFDLSVVAWIDRVMREMRTTRKEAVDEFVSELLVRWQEWMKATGWSGIMFAFDEGNGDAHNDIADGEKGGAA